MTTDIEPPLPENLPILSTGLTPNEINEWLCNIGIGEIPLNEMTQRVHDALGSLLNRFVFINQEADKAGIDELTGLSNRRAFNAHLEEQIKNCRWNIVPDMQANMPPGTEEKRKARPSSASVVVIIDLDKFKVINDKLGHGAGDAFLKHIADFFTKNFRGGDVVARLAKPVRSKDKMVARLGGDEFAMVLPNIGLEDAEKKLGGLREKFAETVCKFNGQDIFQKMRAMGIEPSFSFGCAAIESDKFAADIMHEADNKLYDDKKKRRERGNPSPAKEVRSRRLIDRTSRHQGPGGFAGDKNDTHML